MPVTGVSMLANYPQESHCAKARRPPPRSPVRQRRARAQRVHPWRLPWRPHAYRAALRVSPASKFSERYPSFPPNFTTFGHFLQPTTTWIVLTKPSSALLCKKILAPSKVGLNRKRSDFLDLPNGLRATTGDTTIPPVGQALSARDRVCKAVQRSDRGRETCYMLLLLKTDKT